MRAGLCDMDRGELRPCERAGTFQSFPRDPRPCVCLSSCHASWCSPPTVVPSACMRRLRSYSFLASRRKSWLNDRRRLSPYSFGVNPRPVGVVGSCCVFDMLPDIPPLLSGSFDLPCRTVRNRTGTTIRARTVANLLYRPGCRPASRIRPGNPVPVLPHSQPILLPVFHQGNSYPFSEVHSRNRIRGLAGFEPATSGLNVRRSTPLSYSPAHAHRHDRPDMRDAFTIANGVAEDGVSSTVPIFNRIVDEPAPRPDLRGAAGFEPASASALPIELHPW